MLFYLLTTGGESRESYSVHYSSLLVIDTDDQVRVRKAFEELLGVSRHYESSPTQGARMFIDSDVITNGQLDLAMDHKSLARSLCELGLTARIVAPDLVVLD